MFKAPSVGNPQNGTKVLNVGVQICLTGGGSRAGSLYATPPPPPLGHQQVSLEKTVRRQRRQIFFSTYVLRLKILKILYRIHICVKTTRKHFDLKEGYMRAAGPNSNPNPSPSPNPNPNPPPLHPWLDTPLTPGRNTPPPPPDPRQLPPPPPQF